MKNILLIIFALFLVNTSFSQIMFWNNYSGINPANSGLENKVEVNTIGLFERKNKPYTSYSLFEDNERYIVNASALLKDKHGFGVNYSHQSAYNYKGNSVGLNYNYQFRLKNDAKMSLGTRLNYFSSAYEFADSSGVYDLFLRNNSLSLGFGGSYLSKHILTGINISPLGYGIESNEFSNSFGLNAQFRYAFFLNDKFTLYTEALPSFSYFKSNLGEDYKPFNLALSTRVRWNNKLMFGVDFKRSDLFNTKSKRFQIGGNLSWDFGERLRLGYSYSALTKSVVKTNNHEFTVGFRLK